MIQWRRAIEWVLGASLGLLGLTAMALLLGWLLAALGDREGALAARHVAVWATAGLMASQFLLLNLLALGSLRVKM